MGQIMGSMGGRKLHRAARYTGVYAESPDGAPHPAAKTRRDIPSPTKSCNKARGGVAP